MYVMRLACITIGLLLCVSCGGGSSGASTTATPSPTPAPNPVPTPSLPDCSLKNGEHCPLSELDIPDLPTKNWTETISVGDREKFIFQMISNQGRKMYLIDPYDQSYQILAEVAYENSPGSSLVYAEALQSFFFLEGKRGDSLIQRIDLNGNINTITSTSAKGVLGYKNGYLLLEDSDNFQFLNVETLEAKIIDFEGANGTFLISRADAPLLFVGFRNKPTIFEVDYAKREITTVVEYHDLEDLDFPNHVPHHSYELILYPHKNGKIITSTGYILEPKTLDVTGRKHSRIVHGSWTQKDEFISVTLSEEKYFISRENSEKQLIEQWQLERPPWNIAAKTNGQGVFVTSIVNGHFVIEEFNFNDDRDGDGVDNQYDAFPNEPAASVDKDRDGAADSWHAGYTGPQSDPLLQLDEFPDEPWCQTSLQSTDGECDAAKIMQSIVPDHIVDLRDGRVLLHDKANGRIYIQDLVTRAYLASLNVYEYPQFNTGQVSAIEYSISTEQVYLAYQSGLIRTINLNNNNEIALFEHVYTPVTDMLVGEGQLYISTRFEERAQSYTLTRDLSQDGELSIKYTEDIRNSLFASYNQSTVFRGNPQNGHLNSFADGRFAIYGSGLLQVTESGSAIPWTTNVNEPFVKAVFQDDLLLTADSEQVLRIYPAADLDKQEVRNNFTPMFSRQLNGSPAALIPYKGDVFAVVSNSSGYGVQHIEVEDSDSDNLPGWWEQYHQLNDSLAADSHSDLDSDSLTARQEYLNNTDPNNEDSDNDSLSDNDELEKTGTDPAVADSDSDGLSDGQEVTVILSNPLMADSDEDGLEDGFEVNELGSHPNSRDSDGDEMDDGWEYQHHLSPTSDDSQLDKDDDGLTNLREFVLKTSPLYSDTDLDGLSDEQEVNLYRSDPILADSDGDWIPDGFEVNNSLSWSVAADGELDSDDDGYSNVQEYYLNTDIYDAASVPILKDFEHSQRSPFFIPLIVQSDKITLQHEISVDLNTPSSESSGSDFFRSEVFEVREDLIFVGVERDPPEGRSLRAYNLHTAELVWENSGAPRSSKRFLSADDKNLYFVENKWYSTSKRLVIMDQKSGEITKQSKFFDYSKLGADTLQFEYMIDGVFVFKIGKDHESFALVAYDSDASLLWRREIQDGQSFTLDGEHVYSYRDELIVLKAKTGEEVFKGALSEPIEGLMALTFGSGQNLFATSCQYYPNDFQRLCHLHRIDLESKRVLWTQTSPLAFKRLTSINGRLYIDQWDALFVYNEFTGEKIGEYVEHYEGDNYPDTPMLFTLNMSFWLKSELPNALTIPELEESFFLPSGRWISTPWDMFITASGKLITRSSSGGTQDRIKIYDLAIVNSNSTLLH